MAIIKLGTTVVGIRGTVGGTTYSANKSGNHGKIWTRGANPRTSFQATQRNTQSTWASAWRALTALQQTGWNTYAALPAQTRYNSLGIAYQPSGFQAYVSCNVNLALAGDAAITAAPVAARPGALTFAGATTSATGSANPTQIQVNVTDADHLKRTVLFAQLYNSLGRTVGASRSLMRISFTNNVTGILGYKFFFERKFGLVSIGQRNFVRCCYQDSSGQRGPYTTRISDVTA